MPGSPSPRALRELLEPVVAGAGVELEDVRVTRAGRRSVVAVVVDADGGPSLDAVADVTRAVADALDAADALVPAGSYTLEVGTPGVERPLTEPRHWRRARGRLVRAVLRDGGDVTGRVVAPEGDEDPGQPVLEVDGARRVLDPAAVARATVQVEFSRGP